MRKRLFVDSEVQGELLRRCVCHWFVFGLTTLALLLPLHYMVNELDRPLSAGLQSTWGHYKLLVVVLLVVLPALLYDLVKLSHRFAGPITRLRNEIRRAARGERVEPVHFRANDFWRDLADEFNALVERYQQPALNHESDTDNDMAEEVVESRPQDAEHCDSMSVPAASNS